MKKITINESNRNTVIATPAGAWDDTTVQFAVAFGVKDMNMFTQTESFKSFKDIVVGLARQDPQPSANKNNLTGFVTCEFNSSGVKRNDANVISRNWVMLDFDYAGTAEFEEIHDRLKDFVYVAWTTFSHVIKGNRFRVALPFATPVAAADWKQVSASIDAFNELNFQDHLRVDPTSLSMSQVGFGPCINSDAGRVELYFNDSENTRLFDPVADTPNVVVPVIVYDKSENISMETAQMQAVIAMLKTHSELNYSLGYNERLNWACAIRGAGGSEWDFVEFDNFVRKPDATTPGTTLWKASASKSDCHAGLILSTLTVGEKIACGLITKKLVSASNVKSVEVVKSPVTQIDLPAGQYLSNVADQINFTDYSRSAIIGGTGIGKSNYVARCVKGPRIIACPTQSLVDQFAASYGATPVHGGVDYRQTVKGREFIAVTYASLVNLTEAIGKEIYDYTLFLDEEHGFSTNSSRDFQYQQLKSVVDILPRFKRVVHLTATPVTNTHPALAVEHTWTIKNPGKARFKLREYTCENVCDAVIDMTNKWFKDGCQVPIYLNNTQEDGQYGKFRDGIEELTGTIVAGINSKMKDSDVFRKVVIDGDASDNPITINTSVVTAGVSITKHLPHVNIPVVGSVSSEDLIQMSNRYRNAETIEVVIFKKNEFDEVSAIDPAQAYAALIKEVNNRNAHIAAEYEQGLSVAMDTARETIDPNRPIRFDMYGIAHIDHLLFSNRMYELRKIQANKSSVVRREQLESLLSLVGVTWEFEPVREYGSVEVDQEVRDAQAAGREKAKDRRKVAEDKVYDQVSECDAQENIDCVDASVRGDLVLTQTEVKVRTIIKNVAEALKIGGFDKLAPVVEYIRVNNINTVARSQVLLSKTDNLDVLNGSTAIGVVYKKIVGAFEIGKFYSNAQIRSILWTTAGRELSILSCTNVNDAGVARLMNSLFDMTKGTKKTNGKVDGGWLIDSYADYPSLEPATA
jgi:hypothetical protein